eukprot:2195680-Rhodomonas_salina.2
MRRTEVGCAGRRGVGQGRAAEEEVCAVRDLRMGEVPCGVRCGAEEVWIACGRERDPRPDGPRRGGTVLGLP